MTALTRNRDTLEREGTSFVYRVAPGKTVFAGSLVAVDSSGLAQPAKEATGLVCVGRAENRAMEGQPVTCKRGVFLFNHTGDITPAHIHEKCWLVDDQTVSSSSGTNSRSVAGIIVNVETDATVWVRV